MSYGTGIRQRLYNVSPAVVKNVITTAYGLQQRHARYGDDFVSNLALLLQLQFWPRESLLAYQQAQTAQFLRKMVPVTPHYASRPEYVDAARTGDLSGLPLLSKSIVKNSPREFINSDLKEIPHRMVHTSGTTGQALVFPMANSCFQREYAYKQIHYSWGRVSLLNRRPFAFCAGHPVTGPGQIKPPFWTYDHANNHLFMSSYHMSERNLPHYIHELERFQPVMLGGYPSSIYLLALEAQRLGGCAVRPKAVYTFSETLLDFQRALISEMFGCKVFNWYGNTEICANIVECECGEMHMKLEHSFVEVLNDDDKPCGPGETGRLVCTGFGNPAFPLIRYEVGDVVTLSAKQEPACGRAGILVDKVLGRVEDYILTPDGRMVGRLDHLFKDSVNVAEAQICQDRREEVVLRIVKKSFYTERDEKLIMQEARIRLGNEIGIRFEYVDAIPRAPNGKFRFINSNMKQAKTI
ncbi:MAG: phenylacetate--CoA ligase family protein [Kiritimatiellia bacterium]